jgi:hypothetical protein
LHDFRGAADAPPVARFPSRLRPLTGLARLARRDLVRGANEPEATARSREQKRFSRVDKDKDGRIAKEELLAPRRRAYAKLDVDGSGSVSFEEWAVKTLDKFGGADADRSGWLTAAEYASTAPPPPKKARCGC